MNKIPNVEIWTDGSCSGNPGVGGYAAILRCGDNSRILNQGFSLTTNNRMKLMGVIAALDALKRPCTVTLYTDSKYLADNFPRAAGWKANGWKGASGKEVANIDLWFQLLKAAEPHALALEWVKDHSGNLMNEKVDKLAVAARESGDLIPDMDIEF